MTYQRQRAGLEFRLQGFKYVILDVEGTGTVAASEV